MILNQKEYGKRSISVLHGIAEQIRQHLAHSMRIERQGHVGRYVAPQCSLGTGDK
ncbi:hypothetical protein [Polaromonas hydrogenivorans]|uniref:Uncharacterized protein n=1 Tax=Polaromonas hydrogenivorans TaxID=335476 RepID=A0AAU7LYH3_9BURK